MRTSFPVEKIRAGLSHSQGIQQRQTSCILGQCRIITKPKCVIDSISRFYEQANSNVHRGIYQLAEIAEHEYTQARETIANWFSVNTQELIFTRGTTEALNLVANSYGQTALRSGDCIILTEMEHHANIVPWQLTAQKTGARILTVPVLADGSLDREVLSSHLKTPASKILSLCHISIHLEQRIPWIKS